MVRFVRMSVNGTNDRKGPMAYINSPDTFSTHGTGGGDGGRVANSLVFFRLTVYVPARHCRCGSLPSVHGVCPTLRAATVLSNGSQ